MDREPQRAPGPDHVLLADEIVEGRRTEPLREWRRRVQAPARRLAEEVAHTGSMLSSVAAER